MDVNKRYSKKVLRYRCSKEECGKQWGSVHGWIEDIGEKQYCTGCLVKGEILLIMDKTLTLNTYGCVDAACGEILQKLYDPNRPAQEQEVRNCDMCGGDTERTIQERRGRRFSLKCNNVDCNRTPIEKFWEDYSHETQIFQLCSKEAIPGIPCFNRGEVEGVAELRVNVGPRRDDLSHDPRFCTMCQKIIRQNLGTGCQQFKEVEASRGDDGEEAIVQVD